MNKIFIPHPEIPNHYQVKEGYFLITSDMKQPIFRWSRLIRKNYLKDHGFLGHSEIERIDIRVFKHENRPDEYAQLDTVEVAAELESLMVDGKETILHYRAQGEVMVIVTGVDYGMLNQLSDQYRQHYYEYRA